MILKHMLFFTLASFFFFQSCTSTQIQGSSDEKHQLQSLLLLPVQPAFVTGEKNKEQNLKLEAGAAILDQLLDEQLAANQRIKILSKEQTDAMASELTGSGVAHARRIGEKAGADGVMHFILHTWKEREGTNYSVENPASVAFEYKLIHVSTGKVLCSGMFDETQQAFLQNIFSFSLKKGLRWLTVREFAQQGLEKKLAGCAYLTP